MNAPPARRVPLAALVALGWIGLYALMMSQSGWAFAAPSVWGLGSPPDTVLERFGALVPARPAWTSFLLSPWLHRSLLGLVLYLLFLGGTAKQVQAFAGTARTWILFVLGGAAGAAAHLLAHPESVLPAGAGPFDALSALVGASLCWGLFSGSPHAARVRNGALVTVLLVGGLTWWAQRDADAHPELWTLLGVEAMAAAFGTGFVLMVAMGPRRAARPARRATRGLALGLTLALLAAAAVQGADVAASADRGDVGALLGRLESAEYRAYELSRDQVHATDAKRAFLAGLLDAVLDGDPLDGDARAALRAYLEALRAYCAPVRLPWVAEGACRKAFDAWYEGHEKPLRASRHLAARDSLRFYWRPR